MVIKIKGNQTITLVEENKTITDKEKLLTFNEYFADIIPSLGITYFQVNNDDGVNNDKISNTITKLWGPSKHRCY